MDAAFRSASPLSGRSAAGGCGSSSLSRGARSAISARRCQIFAGSNRIFESLSNSSSTSIFLEKSSSAIFISIDYYLHSYCNVLSLKDSGPLDHLRYPHRHLLPPTNSRSDDRGPSLCHWQAATFRRSSSEIARAGMAIDAIAKVSKAFIALSSGIRELPGQPWHAPRPTRPLALKIFSAAVHHIGVCVCGVNHRGG